MEYKSGHITRMLLGKPVSFLLKIKKESYQILFLLLHKLQFDDVLCWPCLSFLTLFQMGKIPKLSYLTLSNTTNVRKRLEIHMKKIYCRIFVITVFKFDQKISQNM